MIWEVYKTDGKHYIIQNNDINWLNWKNSCWEVIEMIILKWAVKKR